MDSAIQLALVLIPGSLIGLFVGRLVSSKLRLNPSIRKSLAEIPLDSYWRRDELKDFNSSTHRIIYFDPSSEPFGAIKSSEIETPVAKAVGSQTRLVFLDEREYYCAYLGRQNKERMVGIIRNPNSEILKINGSYSGWTMLSSYSISRVQQNEVGEVIFTPHKDGYYLERLSKKIGFLFKSKGWEYLVIEKGIPLDLAVILFFGIFWAKFDGEGSVYG